LKESTKLLILTQTSNLYSRLLPCRGWTGKSDLSFPLHALQTQGQHVGTTWREKRFKQETVLNWHMRGTFPIA
jgi:hypothetical protein